MYVNELLMTIKSFSLPMLIGKDDIAVWNDVLLANIIVEWSESHYL